MMTKERKMELSMVNSYGIGAMEDILDQSRLQQLNQEVEEEMRIRQMMDPKFTDQLMAYAEIHKKKKVIKPSLKKEAKQLNLVGCLPSIPAFLTKYVE